MGDGGQQPGAGSSFPRRQSEEDFTFPPITVSNSLEAQPSGALGGLSSRDSERPPEAPDAAADAPNGGGLAGTSGQHSPLLALVAAHVEGR